MFDGEKLNMAFNKGNLMLKDPYGIIKDFRIIGFHFHSPGEHTIDGYAFNLEMHISFVDSEGL